MGRMKPAAVVADRDIDVGLVVKGPGQSQIRRPTGAPVSRVCKVDIRIGEVVDRVGDDNGVVPMRCRDRRVILVLPSSPVSWVGGSKEEP